MRQSNTDNLKTTHSSAISEEIRSNTLAHTD